MKDLIWDSPALKNILNEMIEVSGYLWTKGWAERNAGNLSVDITDHISGKNLEPPTEDLRRFDDAYPVLAGRYFLVTGSGRRFRDMAKDPTRNACVLQLSEDGGGYSTLWGGAAGPDFRPTSEFPAHMRVHEELRKNDAPERTVLHTHPSELIALTHLPDYREEAALNRALWCVHPEVKYNLPKGVGFVPYVIPGSEALAQATVECFRRNYPVVLWEMHGCVAKAVMPMEAFDLIDIVTKAAGLLLLCRSAGHTPTGLSKEQLDEIVRTFGLEE